MRHTRVTSFTNLCISASSCPEAVKSVALYRQGTNRQMVFKGACLLVCLLTYLLICPTQHSPSLEVNSPAASQEISRILWNPKVTQGWKTGQRCMRSR